MRRIGLSLLLFSAFIAAPSAVSAQVLGAQPLILTASPEFPHPYDTVVITPSSSLVNLTASTLSYSVNGKAAGKGGGSSAFQIQVGASGAPTKIDVSITGPDGTYSTSLTLVPSDVDLIMEPQTTTHPLYPGGSLTASQGNVRFVALADLRVGGKALDPKTLVYQWRLGNQALIPQSGIGRSVLLVTAPERYRSANISVSVSDPSGMVNGEASVDLSPAEPLMRVYEYDPLLGPRYEHALSGTFPMKDTEGSFVAVPYFFSKTPNIAWSVAGSAAGQGPIVTVKSAGSGQGSASLIANATGASALESAATDFVVSFTGPQSGGFGLFGL